MSPDTLSLAGKVAIITGSGRENGIGAEIARALARNGAKVVLNHVSNSTSSRAARVAQEIEQAGGVAIVIQADMSKPKGATKLVRETMELLGTKQIDILVNNAGMAMMTPSLEASIEEIQNHFAINTFAPLHMVRESYPFMPRGSRIVNVGTVASKQGAASLGLYSASKAALDSLTWSWAAELGRSHGITVNTVAVGPCATDLSFDMIRSSKPVSSHSNTEFNFNNTDKPAPPPASSAAVAPRREGKMLLDQTRMEARLTTPKDVADAVLLLCSDKAGWITGQYIGVNGGITGSM